MLYKGSTKIADVYHGSTKIKEIYHGSTLVYSAGYPSGTILFENSAAGTYTLQVDYDCTIHLDLVGGGGYGLVINGGEGAYISGDMALTAGTYTIVIGRGGSTQSGTLVGDDSTFENNIAGGGKNGGLSSGGEGGTATVVTQGLIGQNGGNRDTTGWINGYGAGGSNNGDGVDGYCKIEVV